MKQRQQSNYSGLSRAMFLIAWLLFLVMLAYFFSSWIAYKNNPNQDLNGHTSQSGVHEIVLKENNAHHYVLNGKVNGTSAEFMIDTGSSNVSIPGALVDKLQLTPSYPILARTANGTVTVYATTIKVLEIGPIRLYNVPASINPHMISDQILLGMSVLKQLEFTLRHGHMILIQYPE